MSDPLEIFRPLEGFLAIYNRARTKLNWTRIHQPEDTFAQATAVNDGFELAARASKSIGNAVMRDGDRVTGGGVEVDQTAGTLILDKGEIYVQGEVREVQAAVLNGVAMTGDRAIGVRITSTAITHVEDPDLLGLQPDTDAHGEPGPVVEVQTIAWGWDGDGQTGSLVPVYRLVDGVIIDQSPPADLSVASQPLRDFAEKTHGNFITDGFVLHAIGKVGNEQTFSLKAGSAYIRGQDITRFQDMRIAEVEDPDTGTVDAEPHTFDDEGSGTATITLRRTPVQSIENVIVTKETTETLSRGSGASDTLANDSVLSIVLVEQGGTPYEDDTDYYQDGDTINWSPGGDEPATASSYTVTYRYLDSVPVDGLPTPTTVTVSGGVTGGLVLVQYFFKLPRIDRLCLGSDGLPVYIKGQSSALNPLPPVVPDVLLQIATISNDWFGAPDVDTDGTRNITFEQQHRYNRITEDLLDLVGLERLDRDIDRREPTAKRGTFVDPFVDARYRDAGEPQTAAVFAGGMELPITRVFEEIDLTEVVTLPYTEEVVIQQLLSSDCMKINPYMNFTPPPARMTLTPSVDLWEESETAFDDDVTRSFGTGNRSIATVTTEDLGTTQRQATFLRQIQVRFDIEGMGGGENLELLEMEGVDVTPPGLTADSQGNLSGTFTIPAGIATGIKAVAALGQGGSGAAANFVGQGTVTTRTLRRVTTISRWADPPPQINNGGGNNFWQRDSGDEGGRDPLAQSFILARDRMVTGIDLQFCAIGDQANPVIVELVSTDEHTPTQNLIAQCEIDMTTVLVGQWTQARLAVPVFLPRDVPFAWKLITNDADHAVRIATNGDFDENEQSFVGAQPYTNGVLFSSSLDGAWQPHHNSDMMIRMHAAAFDPTTRTVDLGTFSDVAQVSDIIVRAGVDLPTDQARCVFEIEFDDTSVQTVEASQPLRLDAFYDGGIKLRAILTGTREISPVLFAHPLLVLGILQTTGTYVMRAFSIGEAARLTSWMKTLLPTGSTLTVEYDKTDGNWIELASGTIEQIELGWQDRKFEASPVTATTGRLRLTLTGNPAARPVISDLRGAII